MKLAHSLYNTNGNLFKMVEYCFSKQTMNIMMNWVTIKYHDIYVNYPNSHKRVFKLLRQEVKGVPSRI